MNERVWNRNGTGTGTDTGTGTVQVQTGTVRYGTVFVSATVPCRTVP